MFIVERRRIRHHRNGQMVVSCYTTAIFEQSNDFILCYCLFQLCRCYLIHNPVDSLLVYALNSLFARVFYKNFFVIVYMLFFCFRIKIWHPKSFSLEQPGYELRFPRNTQSLTKGPFALNWNENSRKKPQIFSLPPYDHLGAVKTEVHTRHNTFGTQFQFISTTYTTTALHLDKTNKNNTKKITKNWMSWTIVCRLTKQSVLRQERTTWNMDFCHTVESECCGGGEWREVLLQNVTLLHSCITLLTHFIVWLQFFCVCVCTSVIRDKHESKELYLYGMYGMRWP